RPWDRFGEVHTVFELAQDPNRSGPLAEHADLLLWQCDDRYHVASTSADGRRGKMAPAEVRLTLAGVWLQDVLFVIPPRVVEVRRKVTGYELVLGNDHFRAPDDPEGLSRLLERWFRWVF